MKRVILFGTGLGAELAFEQFAHFSSEYRIAECWDNNKTKHGSLFHGIEVVPPHSLRGVDNKDICKVIIASSFYDEIKQQLIRQFSIPVDYICSRTWLEKETVIQYYSNHLEERNDEIDEILHYLEENELAVFNYPYMQEYEKKRYNVRYDKEKGMFYVMRNGQSMFFTRKYKSRDEVEGYYRSLCEEQDVRSPHCYKSFVDSEYDVIIDCGCAEGIFVVDNKKKDEKCICIEAEKDWCEALSHTFEKEDKTYIIQSFLSDEDSETCISLDTIVREQGIERNDRVLVKMDIEGAEEKALQGGHQLLSEIENLTVLVCAYHHQDAEERIRSILERYHLTVTHSNGYMFFPAENERKTVPYMADCVVNNQFRRGILIGKRGM